VEIAAAKVDQVFVSFLPKLKLTAQYRRISDTSSGFGGGALVGARNAGPIRANCGADPTNCAILDAQGEGVGAQPFNIESVVDQYSLQASLSLPVSDYVLRMSRAIHGAKTSQEAALLTVRAESTKNASDARVAYYNWLRSVAAVAVAESSLARTQALLKDSEAAFAVGSATKADVLRLQALVASTELSIAESRNMRALAQEQLSLIMGEPPRSFEVGESVLAGVRPQPPADPEQLVREAEANRLELAALRTVQRSFDDGIKALRIGRYPRLDAFGDYTYANPNQLYFPPQAEWNPSWVVGLSLSYSPNDTAGTGAQLREYRAQRRKLATDETQLRRGIRLEVTGAELERRRAEVAVSSAQRGSEAAREAYRVARDLYRVGRATTTDLIAAESELVLAELRQVNALIDNRVAAVKLAHAVGRDVKR
jgi:outer membrane protein TolC